MNGMAEALVMAVISSLVTGVITGVAVVAALKVHIQYLREAVDRAHSRIDFIERGRVPLTAGGQHNGT